MATPETHIPIFYLDDDVESLRTFESDMARAVVNPVRGLTTADELYANVTGESPCIIFVDLILPELIGGGYEVISHLRQMAKGRGPVIAVIAVTASSREDSVKEAAYQAGADVFLYKPISPAAAIKAIVDPGWFRVQFQP